MKNITYKQVIWLITYAALLFAVFINITPIIETVKSAAAVIQPLLLGAVFALSFDCLVCFFEKALFRNSGSKASRKVSVLLTMTCVVAVTAVMIGLLIPGIVRSIRQLADNVPVYIETLLGYLDDTSRLLGLDGSAGDAVVERWDGLRAAAATSVSALIATLFDLSKGIFKLLLGIIFSIYLLIDKERVKKAIRLALEILFKNNGAKAYAYTELFAIKFKRFISGQIIVAVILGTLCFLGMVIIGLPYAAIISVIIGITSIIPVLGGYLGAAAAVLLLVLENPVQALIFALFIFALQQFEGAVIYPKIVGGSIGIDGILVFIGVTLGAGFGGVWGLILGVPLIAVLYSAAKTNNNII